jgi:hypothetical protein
VPANARAQQLFDRVLNCRAPHIEGFEHIINVNRNRHPIARLNDRSALECVSDLPMIFVDWLGRLRLRSHFVDLNDWRSRVFGAEVCNEVKRVIWSIFYNASTTP